MTDEQNAVIHPSKELVERLKSRFHLRDDFNFNPSLWFSYGSNLDSKYFEAKMKKKESTLKLQHPKKATIGDYVRKLDNRSYGHGLGYEIHYKPGSRVGGIVHQVPLEHLPAYLWMEGVLDKDLNFSESLTYDVKEVPVRVDRKEIQALTLIGNKASGRELKEYVQASLRGARRFRVGARQFQRDLVWARTLQ
jgi:hypothetical protein